MRIDAYNQISQMYGVGKSKKTGHTGNIGKDMQIAKAALAKTPDVRKEKVDAIKTAIQNGTYEVSNESFAEKLVSAYNNRGI